MALVENIERGMIVGGAAMTVDRSPEMVVGGIGVMLTAGVIEIVKNIKNKRREPKPTSSPEPLYY